MLRRLPTRHTNTASCYIDRKTEAVSLLPLANKVDCEYRPQGIPKYDPQNPPSPRGWLGSRVVSVLDSGAEGPGFKSHPRRCRVAVLGKLFTPIVLLSLGSTRADDFLAYGWLFYLLLPLSRRC